MTPQELDDLQNKIDYEGGLVEYVCHYAGSNGMPEEVREQAKAVETAVQNLESAFRTLLKENNVELL